jgi:DNA-binding transcriptional regulator of glucitol operon
MIRDGNPALVSRGKSSIVLVRPAARTFAVGARPIYVVAITNIAKTPIEFRMSNVAVTQVVNQQATALKVLTFEELAQEERNRQVMSAILVGVAAGANAAAASQAGRYSSTSTVTTPRGRTYEVHTSGYSPAAAAIAQSNAAAQNEAMIGATIERGQQNMAALEGTVIKDNTLLPGEWYGGALHIAPLVSTDEASKTYTITIQVGADRHDVLIAQGPAAQS